MIKLKNKFAIGCLIQWYEIELIPLYLESVKQSLDHIENKENISYDLIINLAKVNHVRRINKFHEQVNEKINFDGFYIFCAETISKCPLFMIVGEIKTIGISAFFSGR